MDWNADNNTTYDNFVKSGIGAKAGLVPAPSKTAGTTKYLREDGAWAVPPDTKTSIINNQTTTEAGYALDARQANPNIDGTLAKQVADLNGNLKMIDCGIGAFSKSDSALNVGTTMKTRVKFNKTFDRDPVVVVSWSELHANDYLNYLTIDRLTVDGEGFEAITRTKDADTWKYTWYFSWIAIAN